jgi:hypothetical protein
MSLTGVAEVRIRLLSTVVTMTVMMLVLVLSMPSGDVRGAESISDSELSILYGGCWFYNPYCGDGENDCAEYTECSGCEKCRFCAWRLGLVCKDRYNSWWPDFDGCEDGNRPCENRPWDTDTPSGIPQVYGECVEGVCVEELHDPSYVYPNCGDSMRYDWCDD